MDIAGKVLKMRHDGHALIKMIGGRAVHPNWGLPGGVSRGIDESQRKEIEARGLEAVEFAKFSLKILDDVVLANKNYVELITGDVYLHKTYNMGMVDAEQLHELLRRPDPHHQSQRQGSRQVRLRRLPRVHRRAGRAVVVPEVPLSEEDRLEGFCRRRGVGRLQGHAAVALQRGRRHGHAAGQRRIQADVRDAGRQAGASHAGHALGPAGRVALCGRALGRAVPRSGDHRQGISHAAHRHADRGRRLRRGPPRHAHAPLRHRRARHPHHA